MRKLFLILVAIFLMASSAYAWNETAENGPQQITVCWATGTTDMTSGNVVVLNTSSPTYPGKEVTGTTTAGRDIYGVVVDTTTYTPHEMKDGNWIRVQTYGYNSAIKTTTAAGLSAAITAGDALATSGTVFRSKSNGAGLVTTNAVSFDAEIAGLSTGTVAGFIGGGS